MKQHPCFGWLLFAGCAVVWGSSFTLMKRGLVVFRPHEVATLRVVLAAACLLPLAIYYLRKFKYRLPYRRLFVSVMAGNVLPAFIYNTAMLHIGGAVGGVLNSTSGLFAFVLGLLCFGAPFQVRKMLGVLVGLVGAAALVWLSSPNAALGPEGIAYGLLVLVATALYGFNVNYVRTYLAGVPSMAIASVSLMLGGALLALPLFAFTDVVGKLRHVPGAWEAFGYVALLGAVGTATVLGLFYYLIQNHGPLFGASVAYAIPIVAVLWGLADGEAVGWMQVACMGVILAGVWLVSRQN